MDADQARRFNESMDRATDMFEQKLYDEAIPLHVANIEELESDPGYLLTQDHRLLGMLYHDLGSCFWNRYVNRTRAQYKFADVNGALIGLLRSVLYKPELRGFFAGILAEGPKDDEIVSHDLVEIATCVNELHSDMARVLAIGTLIEIPPTGYSGSIRDHCNDGAKALLEARWRHALIDYTAALEDVNSKPTSEVARNVALHGWARAQWGLGKLVPGIQAMCKAILPIMAPVPNQVLPAYMHRVEVKYDA